MTNTATTTATATATIHSCVIQGSDALGVDIEAQLSDRWEMDLTSAAASRETLVRVRSAFQTIAVPLRAMKFSAHLPVPPAAGALDLATAMAALVVLGVLPAAALEGLLVVGELGLDGSVRATRGVLSAALLARASGLRGILVPASCAWQARMVDRIQILAADDLAGAIVALRGGQDATHRTPAPMSPAREEQVPDMSEVRGQDAAIAAIAGLVRRGRGMLLVGPPGTGKTMLARRVSALLPEMTAADSVAVTRVHTALGLAGRPITQRPFRAPHHTISTAALCGDAGPSRRPGELQLATRGVLFLDELAEFRASSISSLAHAIRRMPDEDRPLLVVASANPCPCGWYGSEVRSCACSPRALEQHQARVRTLAGELGILVRADGDPAEWEEDVVRVESLSLSKMHQSPPGESSASIRARIWARDAREADQDEAFL